MNIKTGRCVALENPAAFEVIIKEARDARKDLFQYNIETGIQKTIGLIQKLTPLAKEAGKEQEMNRITVSLMTALQQKDYLLFSDIACYEIPALFDKPSDT